MIRVTARLLENPGMSKGRPVFHGHAGDARQHWLRRALRRRLQCYRRRGLLGKMATLGGYCAGCGVMFALFCAAAHAAHQPGIDRLFLVSRFPADAHAGASAAGAQERPLRGDHGVTRYVCSDEHYTLETWEAMESTLREGDIVLMRGTGPMSWCIATAQYAYSLFRAPALYYSHVAVVVQPAVYARRCDIDKDAAPPQTTDSSSRGRGGWGWPWRRRDGAAARPKSTEDILNDESARQESELVKIRGAVMLEAMDNSSCGIADIHGEQRSFSVQLVEAEKRLCSSTRRQSARGEVVVPAYRYCAVRQLQNVSRTDEWTQRVRAFAQRNEGRPMETSALYATAFISPALHRLLDPSRAARGTVSCGELIAELFEELDVTARHWRWVRIADAQGRAVLPPTARAALLAPVGAAGWSGPREQRAEQSALPVTGPEAAPDGTSVEQSAQQQQQQQRGEAAKGLPAPTPADLQGDRGSGGPQMHVYDRSGSHRRPAPERFTCVEGWTALADAPLMAASSLGCATLSPEERRLLLDTATAFLATEGTPAAAATAGPASCALTARADALISGATARLRDGGTAQLQFYYKRDSLLTTPYCFTAGEAERVLDFAATPTQKFALMRMQDTPVGRLALRTGAASADTANELVLVERTAVAAGAGQLIPLGEKECSSARSTGPCLGPEQKMQLPHTVAL